jgi:hypothetical protein
MNLQFHSCRPTRESSQLSQVTLIQLRLHSTTNTTVEPELSPLLFRDILYVGLSPAHWRLHQYSAQTWTEVFTPVVSWVVWWDYVLWPPAPRPSVFESRSSLIRTFEVVFLIAESKNNWSTNKYWKHWDINQDSRAGKCQPQPAPCQSLSRHSVQLDQWCKYVQEVMMLRIDGGRTARWQFHKQVAAFRFFFFNSSSKVLLSSLFYRRCSALFAVLTVTPRLTLHKCNCWALIASIVLIMRAWRQVSQTAV